MLSFDIEKAIKFPFKDPKWPQKVGIFFGIQIFLTVIIYALQYSPYFFTLFDSTAGDTQASQSGLLFMLAIFGMIGVMLLSIPYWFYLTGYIMEITKNVMDGKELPIPEHSNFGYKFKLFGVTFLIGLGPGLLAMMIIFALIIPAFIITGASAGSDAFGPSILIMIFYILFAIFIGIVLMVVLFSLVVPAMFYLYLKKGSLGAAFDLASVKRVIQAGWKNFIIATLLTFALSIGAQAITLASWLCLLGWAVGPLAQIWLMLSQSHLLGQVYKDLSEKGVE